jgi:hypothetical protein
MEENEPSMLAEEIIIVFLKTNLTKHTTRLLHCVEIEKLFKKSDWFSWNLFSANVLRA